MSVYLVARGRVTDPQKLDDYLAKALPTIPASARVLAADLDSEVIEGETDRLRTVLIEFPSREDFRAWYDSPAYQEALPLRLASAPGTMVVVDGLEPVTG
jgi:uncharacterized protein (DUF1330 family)